MEMLCLGEGTDIFVTLMTFVALYDDLWHCTIDEPVVIWRFCIRLEQSLWDNFPRSLSQCPLFSLLVCTLTSVPHIVRPFKIVAIFVTRSISQTAQTPRVSSRLATVTPIYEDTENRIFAFLWQVKLWCRTNVYNVKYKTTLYTLIGEIFPSYISYV